MKSLAPDAGMAQILRVLQNDGIAQLDAELLLLHSLAKPATERAWLFAHGTQTLSASAQGVLKTSIERYQRGEPLAYIVGQQSFYGLDLLVDERVLVPRPDTETLVDWALELIAERSALAFPITSVRDLGTGSGAIALALKAMRPELHVSASDASQKALTVARANAQRLQLAVDFFHASWLSGCSERFGLIVANPPYVAAHDPHLPALAFEPTPALVSGADGLQAIRDIIAQAGSHLLGRGWLLLEHGYDQASAVRALLIDAGFADVRTRRDLAGVARCSGGQWPALPTKRSAPPLNAEK